jgi:hypothetical protein
MLYENTPADSPYQFISGVALLKFVSHAIQHEWNEVTAGPDGELKIDVAEKAGLAIAFKHATATSLDP